MQLKTAARTGSQTVGFCRDRTGVDERPRTAREGNRELHPILGGSTPVPALHTEARGARKDVHARRRDRRPSTVPRPDIQPAADTLDSVDRSELGRQLQNPRMCRVLREHDRAEDGIRVLGDAATGNHPEAEDRTCSIPAAIDVAEEGEISDQVICRKIVADEAGQFRTISCRSRAQRDLYGRSRAGHGRLQAQCTRGGTYDLGQTGTRRALISDHEFA